MDGETRVYAILLTSVARTVPKETRVRETSDHPREGGGIFRDNGSLRLLEVLRSRSFTSNHVKIFKFK